MTTNRSIFTYLSDEYIDLHNVSATEFWFALNTASLFFDEIPMSSAALLGHRYLLSAWDSPEWASHLYSSGLIRPILMGDNQSLADVATSMIKRQTIHHASENDALLKHAESVDSAIDAASFEGYWVDEGEFRDRYSTAFEQVVDGLRSRGRWLSETKELIQRGELDKLHIWAKERAGSQDLRASSVYSYLDEIPGRFSPAATKEVKLLADQTYYWILRNMLATSLTVPRSEFGQADLVYLATTPDRGVSVSGTEPVLSEVECELPFDSLAMLSVREVLELRGSPAFRELRSTLHDVRNGKIRELQRQIREKVASCLTLLQEFTRAGRPYVRSEILANAEKRRHASKIKVLVLEPAKAVGVTSVLGIAVVKGAAAIGISVPDPVGPWVEAHSNWAMAGAAVIGAAGLILDRTIRRSRPGILSFPEWNDPVDVNLIDGGITENLPNRG